MGRWAWAVSTTTSRLVVRAEGGKVVGAVSTTTSQLVVRAKGGGEDGVWEWSRLGMMWGAWGMEMCLAVWYPRRRVDVSLHRKGGGVLPVPPRFA